MDINYDFGNEEKLSYHIAYANLAANKRSSPVTQGKVENEQSYVLSMNYQYPFNSNILAEGFLEYANSSNLDGNIDKDTDFLTATLSLKFWKNYSILIGRYKEKAKELGTNGTDTELKELNLGYEFDKNSIFKNFKILAGITRETIDNKTSKTRNEAFVSMVRYSIDF